MTYSIYALAEPGTGVVRYVGITRMRVRQRLAHHICDARNSGERNHRSCWLRSLEARGLRPEVALLETTDDPLRERHWIARFRSEGADLVNSSEGCESHIGYVPPASVRLAVSKAKRGRPLSAEHRAVLLRAITGRPISDKTRAALAGTSSRRAAARTHCKNGHEVTKANIQIRPDGFRECRPCRKAIKRRHNDRLKTARAARGHAAKGRPWSAARRSACAGGRHA